MKEIKIKQLAYYLKEAKKNNQPQPIFFLGAGASVSGNIPLARKITSDILEKFADNPAFEELKDKDKEYAKLMARLSPDQRNELLKNYIDEAKINVTHIYLAQFLKNGFADYVLTVNFDNLMLRALALYNIFPPTYDMAVLKDLTTTTFPEKSVVYLHGQHHGLWLLNTDDEMSKVAKTVPRIFDRISNRRPWIFIGYSGSDPIFEHICNLGRFDNGLYWVGYNDNDPNPAVTKFLNDPHKNAYYIKGYDADAFMLKLNQELKLEQPQILAKPFSSLQEMLEEINDINDEEHFKPVKERLEIAKKNVSKAIEKFEEGKIETTISEQELQIDRLKQEIIQLSIAEEYDENQIITIEERAKELNDESLNKSLAELYFNWGNDLGEIAEQKKGNEKEKLLLESIEKYKKATEIDDRDYKSFTNWGNSLRNIAKIKEGYEKEKLLFEATQKYHEAININNKGDIIFYNWGISLFDLAQMKKGLEKEKLLQESIEKYKKATEINNRYDKAFNNWGNSLYDLAKFKQEAEKEKLLFESIEKYQTATKINNKNYLAFNNWGNSLSDLAQIKEGEEKEKFLNLSIENYKQATEINNQYNNAYHNWGTSLRELAKMKEGKEKEKFLQESIDKYQKAIQINETDQDHYYNWGASLSDLAKMKEGKEKEKLLKEALEKAQKSIDLGGSHYNMACVHALLENKTEALQYLDASLARKDVDINFVLEDEDWQHYLEDLDFKAVIEKHR